MTSPRSQTDDALPKGRGSGSRLFRQRLEPLSGHLLDRGALLECGALPVDVARDREAPRLPEMYPRCTRMLLGQATFVLDAVLADVEVESARGRPATRSPDSRTRRPRGSSRRVSESPPAAPPPARAPSRRCAPHPIPRQGGGTRGERSRRSRQGRARARAHPIPRRASAAPRPGSREVAMPRFLLPSGPGAVPKGKDDTAGRRSRPGGQHTSLAGADDVRRQRSPIAGEDEPEEAGDAYRV